MIGVGFILKPRTESMPQINTPLPLLAAKNEPSSEKASEWVISLAGGSLPFIALQ